MRSIIVAFIALLAFCEVCVTQGRLRKYEDTLCVLTGQPARDKAEMHHFANVGTQKCLLFPGGSAKTSHPGHMLYVTVGSAVDKNFVFRLSTANIEIDKSHLDQGSATNEVSRSYVRQLDDAPSVGPAGTAVTGQVLGQILGGGASQQNLFPQSAVTQSAYKAIEQQVHDCLSSGGAVKAAIEWTFNYQTALRTRAYSVRYEVHFFGESTSSTCANIDETFNN